MENIWYAQLEDTPIDHIWAAVSESGLISLAFRGTEAEFLAGLKKRHKPDPVPDPDKLGQVFQQLSRYFSGNLKEFNLPICWAVMTEFQQTVLRYVSAIPYGQLRTYNDIAHIIGNPKTIRAVGRANATNPIPIVVPCHRVIGSNGKLTGFAGGLETKAALLRLEGSWLL